MAFAIAKVMTNKHKKYSLMEIFFILCMKNRSYFLYSCFSCISFGNCYVKTQLTAHSSPPKKGRTAIGWLLAKPKVMTNKHKKYSLMEIFFILRMKNRSYFLYSCFCCISFGNCYVKAQLTAHSSPPKKGRTAIGRLLR